MRRLSSNLSPSMLVALLALFVAVGGSAYAVKTAAAPANSVVTKSIKKGAVTPLKIAPGAVGPAQLGAKAVGTGQEMVTGGGGRTSNGRISISETIPFIGSTEQRWGVLYHNTSGEALTAQVSTFAICASS